MAIGGTHSAAFRRCLIELDVIGLCGLWFQVAPGAPQPKNNDEALITLHYARTQAESIPDKLRCYSHAWLSERGMPSGLPGRLKPKAARLYPHKVEAVGVAVKARTAASEPIARAMEKAMSDAVAACYANGERDPEVIAARMAAARRHILINS
jgi:hypothetical protein